FEAASGKQIPAQISSRRDGDIAECYADPAKARQQLDWRATKTIAQACEDAWRWQSDNPTGYSIK
ncbi:UDP-glucose 4-epimerase, partial [Candidatus Saccharibacteria bacterium]|nr:UDP-glucose 4-epimerase [Candidatus Saccharibacteria bacterium]